MANYLIIAGTSTIGQHLANQLLEAGHSLFVTGRDKAKLDEIYNGKDVTTATLDATDFDAVEETVKQAKEERGGLDGIACMPGSLLLKSAHTTSRKEYDATIAANLTTAFAVTRAAGKHMSDRGGSVVLMASAVALEGLSNHEAIAAAKSGVLGLMRSAAASYASQNIRFNAIAPGLTETDMTTQLTANDTSRKVSEAMHALGRLGKPEQVASAIRFLLEPENDWITGQVLGVDGGLSRVRPKIKV